MFTCGEECTTVRRCYIHESIYDVVLNKLINTYKTAKIGNPLEEGNIMGPLHNKLAV
jgi:acyl-CoA reductase-like NAD-dependent aldehyde dehydrogenase